MINSYSFIPSVYLVPICYVHIGLFQLIVSLPRYRPKHRVDHWH